MIYRTTKPLQIPHDLPNAPISNGAFRAFCLAITYDQGEDIEESEIADFMNVSENEVYGYWHELAAKTSYVYHEKDEIGNSSYILNF